MLRVGVVIRPPAQSAPSQLPAWITTLMHRLFESSFATVSAILYCEETKVARPPVLSGEYWSQKMFDAYEHWDEAHGTERNYALAATTLDPMLAQVPTFCLASTDEATLREQCLDVLLCLEPGSVLRVKVARLGALILDIAETYTKGFVPAVWRQYRNHEIAVTRTLLVTNETALPRILYETSAAVSPFSLAETRNPVYWKAVEVLMRSVRSLAESEPGFQDSLPVTKRSKRDKSGMQMITFARNEILRRVRARSRRAVRANFAKWCIAIRSRTEGVSYCSPSNYRLLVSPEDRFYADPFLFESQGRTWLFFEDFRYEEDRAVISCCELNADGQPQTPFEVLRLPFHLSYPFIFEHKGEVYMLPESRANRTVSLYRAVDFPREWTLDTDFFSSVQMVDSTLHYDGSTWWLFAGVSNGKYSNSDELCLYFADDLRGPWLPHPQNPIVSDVRRARPAGRLFYDRGRLIRPSQDCGPVYGYGLVFSEIKVLTRDDYEEQVISKLSPESVPGNTANHTYNSLQTVEVTDRFFIQSRLAEAATFADVASLDAPEASGDLKQS